MRARAENGSARPGSGQLSAKLVLTRRFTEPLSAIDLYERALHSHQASRNGRNGLDRPADVAGDGQSDLGASGHAAGRPRAPDTRQRQDGDSPLWIQLFGVSANGSAALPLPGAPPAGGAPGVAPWFVRARARLSGAVASPVDLVVQVALIAIVAAVAGVNLLHWPGVQFDEGTYTGNAWAIQHGALAPYTYSYGHPPLAWLLIFAWTEAIGIFGHANFSIDAGRELMLTVTLVSCSLLYALARRLEFSRVAAAGAVILFALSPLAVFYHRAVLLDNPALAWTLAAFVLARSPGRRLWAFAGSGACFAAAVLSKETILVILPALLLAVAQNVDRRTRRYCLAMFMTFFLVTGLAYELYAILKGELVPGQGHVSLLGEMVVQLFTRQATGSLLDPRSITHATVAFWLQLDPWVLGLALLTAPIALARRSTRAVALAYLIQVVMVFRPGYLPAMYVIGLLPFGALMVTGSVEALWRKLRAMSSRRVAWVLAVALAAPAAVVVLDVGKRWIREDRAAMTVRMDGPTRAAERWVVEHVARNTRLIVGDEFWVYLVQHGFDASPVRGGFFSRTVVSYWPLDYDPAVKRHFPGGWRDFDYIVSTPAVRSTLGRTPTTAQALAHSRVVASFGGGANLIEIRAIARGAPANTARLAKPA